MPIVPINYLAVLVCGVVSMILGSVWFGPLFGKYYMSFTAAALSPEKRAAMMKGMWKSYVLMFLAALVMACVEVHAIVYAETYMHVAGISIGLQIGFWSWLGFVMPATIGMVLWDGKPWKLWAVTSGYYLIQLAVFGVILSLWK